MLLVAERPLAWMQLPGKSHPALALLLSQAKPAPAASSQARTWDGGCAPQEAPGGCLGFVCVPTDPCCSLAGSPTASSLSTTSWHSQEMCDTRAKSIPAPGIPKPLLSWALRTPEELEEVISNPRFGGLELSVWVSWGKTQQACESCGVPLECSDAASLSLHGPPSFPELFLWILLVFFFLVSNLTV